MELVAHPPAQRCIDFLVLPDTRHPPEAFRDHPCFIMIAIACKIDDLDPRVVNSTDLLLPFSGESAGAAEREHEHQVIVDRLHESDMYARLIAAGATDADFAWYLDAHIGREIPLHSGAGIGMARVAQFILGLDDIREAVPFLVNRDSLL